MTIDVLPPVDLGSVKTNGVGNGSVANPYVYSFSTANGLEMGTHKIKGYDTANGLDAENVRLDLKGGDIAGTQSAVNFDLRALGSGANTPYAANLQIINVGTIQIGKIWTYIPENYPYESSRPAGTVAIGQDTALGRAGPVEIAAIQTSAESRYNWLASGSVSVYSAGDVKIWDGTTRGNIRTYCVGANSAVGGSGAIVVKHDGNFMANNLSVYMDVINGQCGNIILQGDSLTNGASGSCAIRSIDAWNSGGDGGGDGGSVTLSGYTDVTVDLGINTCQTNTYTGSSQSGGSVSISGIVGDISVGGAIITFTRHGANGHGGNVTVSCGGNITIGGGIDSNASADANDGNLTLTSSSGWIRLAVLDMSSVGWAKWNPGTIGVVTGTVASVATNHTGGAGSPLDPFVTTQTELRVPPGKRVIYYPEISGNAYLAGYSYRVASLGGSPGTGGILTPYTSPGLVVIFK